MNNDIYDNLNEAKTKLAKLQSAVNDVVFGISSEYRQSSLIGLMNEVGRFAELHLDSVCTAVDDAMDELDRLRSENEGLRRENSRFKGPENYLEFHEDRDELQIKPNDF